MPSRAVEGDHVAALAWVVREGLSEVTVELRPE